MFYSNRFFCLLLLLACCFADSRLLSTIRNSHRETQNSNQHSPFPPNKKIQRDHGNEIQDKHIPKDKLPPNDHNQYLTLNNNYNNNNRKQNKHTNDSNTTNVKVGGTIWYVNVDMAQSGDGLSWNGAFKFSKTKNNSLIFNYMSLFVFLLCLILLLKTNTNQNKTKEKTHTIFRALPDALNAAGNGDQIWVAQGIYAPTGDTNDIFASFKISQDGLQVYGGFLGSEESVNDRQSPLPTTKLSGDLGLCFS